RARGSGTGRPRGARVDRGGGRHHHGRHRGEPVAGGAAGGWPGRGRPHGRAFLARRWAAGAEGRGRGAAGGTGLAWNREHPATVRAGGAGIVTGEPPRVRSWKVEVKIGVQNAPRELVLDSAQTPDEVEQIVLKALSGEAGTLKLVDERGRRVLVPAEKVAYVEIAEQPPRPVGFVAS